MNILAELEYIGHNTAAVADLLSNIDDDTLSDVFNALDPAKDTFFRNIAGVEMMKRNLPIDGHGDIVVEKIWPRDSQ
ncbi:hypothetical protein [Bifidobacterium callimiconis]|uniref:Uncharacterized protein n=1 Tax=Bifidobacterium callimiconis TaxID=2306973 RepID=A0A430FFB2_9BIFI|nr:hypothetical protein [Bifidobacterium callimiconis]MBT1176220.1 hypothetical protein [Bifidobacterium callimiconis]RSX51432.1 hypothetical protein D2E23_0695 [Bifidobacterium callimiconis]